MSNNFSLTTFSSSGKLLQIENAFAAVERGSPSIGIRANDGVVIITEKKASSPLVEIDDIMKVSSVTESIGMIYSGVGGDFRILLAKARKIAQKYFLTYQEGIPVNLLSLEMAGIMQEYTQSGGVRPFGVSLLIAGFDFNGPQLYQVDPSGSYWAWKATAVGKNQANSKKFLEKRFNDEMTLEDAINTAILTLKESFEGEMAESNIEIGIVRKLQREETATFEVLQKERVLDYLNEIGD